MMIPSGLAELMDRHDLVVAVVMSLDSGEKHVVGNRAALESGHVVRMLFDDLTVREIEEYLRGQTLPRMVQQGRVCGVICKPTDKIVVGLYNHDERDVTQRYQLSKTIDAEILELWSAMANE